MFQGDVVRGEFLLDEMFLDDMFLDELQRPTQDERSICAIDSYRRLPSDVLVGHRDVHLGDKRRKPVYLSVAILCSFLFVY